MKNTNTLDSAIKQMKFGSKKGFLNFYRGTVSYVYSSAYLLYKDRDEALRFMEDIYIYMYLHINEYKGDGDVKKWVSKELLERYRQLMIGRDISDVNAIQAMQESADLDKDGRKMLELALLSNISFPPQGAGISATWFMLAVLFVSGVVMLSYLIATNIKPKSTIDAGILNESTSGDSTENNAVVSGNSSGTEDGGLKTLSEAQAELEQYLEVYGEPDDSNGGTDEQVIDIRHNEATDGATESIERSTPNTPDVPTVETPTVTEPSAKTPKSSGSSQSDSKNDNSSEEKANSKIDDFMEKVEKLENYSISQ